MKSIYALLLITFFSVNVFAQSEDENDKETEKGFKKENLFTGGSLNLSFGSGSTALGISPFFGYSVNKYLDVAASIGVNYISQKQYDFYGDYVGKVRQTIYGPGAFVRVFPVKFLFAQAQYEYNFIKLKYLYADGSGYPSEKYSANANSLLVGGGFAGGRDAQNKSFYYISVLWDVSGATNSPYVEYNQNGGKRNVPIIRAGYNIALFQNRDGGGQQVRRSRDRRDNF